MTRWLLMALIASLLSLIGLGVWSYYQSSVISSQALTIDSMAIKIDSLNKQMKVREEVGVQRKDAQVKLEKENQSLKGKLNEALKNNPCNDTPIPDDAQRLLKELYSGRP